MKGKQKNNRILVVDDEVSIRKLLRVVLENRGFNVEEAENGEAALKLFSVSTFDLTILDVMMPGIDGFECCRRIRELCDCPILMLTAKGEDYDQVHGLEYGADDYIIKPFSPTVLVARVQALLRRSIKLCVSRSVFGDLMIDPDAREVTVSGARIYLSRKEYDLLAYLMENDNILLSRDQILETVWGYDYLGSSSTVDTHVNRLRNKLGACGVYITTLRGSGYKFEVNL